MLLILCHRTSHRQVTPATRGLFLMEDHRCGALWSFHGAPDKPCPEQGCGVSGFPLAHLLHLDATKRLTLQPLGAGSGEGTKG